jgi:hypothetical protein
MMIRRRTGSNLLLGVLAMAVLTTGCNIFSWTHDEGGSSSSDTLARDARDALLDGKFSEALEYAKKGIENDPPPMQQPLLRWIAASAVLGESGVNLSALMNSLSNPNAGKAGTDGIPGIAEQYQILNLTAQELLALAQSCPQAVAFLSEVLDALRNGDITPADIIGYQFDIELGFSIASLMTAFLSALDMDQDLTNGFIQNPDVQIWADTNGGYRFTYQGNDADPFIKANLICPLWHLYCDALLGLNLAYATAILPATWGPVTCSPTGVGPLPGTPDETYIIGQVLDFAHKGITALSLQYLPCP